MMRMPDTVVIVPTYNERDNVRGIAEAVLASSPRVDLLFVDDGSPDGTGEVCDRIAAENPRVQVMHRPSKQGLGRAYVAGFQWALERGYAFLFEMDCDFSHDPGNIPDLLRALDGQDMVLGSRFIGGIRIINWPMGRLMLSQAAGVYVRRITGMPFRDPTSGYRGYRRELVQSLELDRITSNGYSFQIETLHHAWINGYRIVEMPIIFFERRQGESKMSSHIIGEATWMVWRLWLRSGLRRRPKKRGE